MRNGSRWRARARWASIYFGVGGSAAHASHAVNDFRKICDFEAYAPTDNVSELTARINDEGWETSFSEWLRGSRLGGNDALLVFSVGGGDAELGVSTNLVRALELAQERKSAIFGIVGRSGGFTAKVADACIVIPPLFADHVTPHTEGLCSVMWHLLVSHPALAQSTTRWESIFKPDEVMSSPSGHHEYLTNGAHVFDIADLSVKIFADGADLKTMVDLVGDPTIAGFTTNPTLMRQSGVTDYEKFACEALDANHRSTHLLRGLFRRSRRYGTPSSAHRKLG